MKLYYYTKNLQLKRVGSVHYLLTLIIMFAVFSSLGFSAGVEFSRIIEKIPIILRENDEEFSEENLKEEIKRLDFKYPDIIYAQAVLETNNFKSSIFKVQNNLFGMKESFTRPSTGITCKNKQHVSYVNWKESVMDRAIWDAGVILKVKSEAEYLQVLGEIYAEDDLYVSKLKKLLNR